MIGILFMVLLLISLFRTEEYSYPYCSRQRLAKKYQEDQMWKNIGFKRSKGFMVTEGKRGGVCISGSGQLKSKFKLKNWFKRKSKSRNAKIIGKTAIILASVVFMYQITGSLIVLGLLGAAFTSKATGNWDSEGATTWNEAGHPGAGDTVTVQNTHTVTLDSATVCTILTIDNGGVVTDATNNVGLTVTGTTNVAGTLIGGTATFSFLTFNVTGTLTPGVQTITCNGPDTDFTGATITNGGVTNWTLNFVLNNCNFTPIYTDEITPHFYNITVGTDTKTVTLLENVCLENQLDISACATSGGLASNAAEVAAFTNSNSAQANPLVLHANATLPAAINLNMTDAYNVPASVNYNILYVKSVDTQTATATGTITCTYLYVGDHNAGQECTFDINTRTITSTGNCLVGNTGGNTRSGLIAVSTGELQVDGNFVSDVNSSGVVPSGVATMDFGGTVTMNGGTVGAAVSWIADWEGDVLVAGGTLSLPDNSGSCNIAADLARTSGTITHNSGTITFDGGGAQQDITSGSQVFYILQPVNAHIYLKDDLEAYEIQILGTATLEIDAISEGTALILSFTDAASCGFNLADNGTFLCQGNGTFGITITSAAGAGVTNYWRMNVSDDLIMDYTTLEYFSVCANDADWDVDNCTFQNCDGSIMVVITGTVTSFTNNTITGSASQTGCTFGLYGDAAMIFTNLTITTPAAVSVKFDVAQPFEFINSSFDFAKLSFTDAGASVISDGHNTVATDYYIATGATATLVKSTVTNDFATGYNVVFTEGAFRAEEPSACLSFDVQAGTILYIDAVTYGAGMVWTWDDVAGCGFGTSAGTLVCIGNGSFGLTLTSENTPPGVYWDFVVNNMTITMDYTTISYLDYFDPGVTTTLDIDNCTFNNGGNIYLLLLKGTITSFDSNVITGSATQSFCTCCLYGITITNCTINENGAAVGISSRAGVAETIDCTFDITKVTLHVTGNLISKDHAGVAGIYHIWSGSNTTFIKSDITNDFGSTDNVTIQLGKFQADVAIAHNNMTIKNGAELEIDGNVAWTIDQGATVLIESGGTLDITGTAGNLITIRSSTPTMEWILTAETGSTVSVSYCDVQDSNATTSDFTIDASDGTNVDSDRNTNWDFGVSVGGTGAASSMALSAPFWTGMIFKSLFLIITTILIYHFTGYLIPAFFGAVNTFDNGNASNSWSDADNWDLGHKPVNTEDVVISTGGADKCTMDENSVDSVNSITIQAAGELELATFTLYCTSFFTNSGTFTCNTGTVDFKGAIQQDITSGGDAFNILEISNTTNPIYLKDDTEIWQIEIKTNTTLEIDAVSEGAALTLSFTDSANCGFTASTGTLLCQGSAINGVTITSVGVPPTNYYDAATADLNLTMDYTTFSYHEDLWSDGTWDVDNCTFANAGDKSCYIVAGATITSFTNNTIIGGAVGFWPDVTYTGFNNISISGTSTYDIYIDSNTVGTMEFTNSNFDFSKSYIAGGGTATIISKNHNDGSDYNIRARNTLSKSTVINDFGTGDNVIIYAGILIADEAIAHANMMLKNSGGTELEIADNIIWTIDQGATVTVENTSELDITGSTGNLITIRSATPTMAWNLNAEAGSTVTVSYVDVQDSDASTGDEINASDGTNVDSGRNINWDFGVANPGGGAAAAPPIILAAPFWTG